MIGRRLQQYLVVAKAGEGGMGVVWKARDTRLDRDVALKLLPDGIADAIGRERFVREAKSASALNHPNIVTIYEIDSDHGVDFIAMEFVSGETLAQRLARGPLEVPVVIACARQIADALCCAHEAGIIHRDLKPGNIMITSAGAMKVLDFGLAKPGQSDAAAESPTIAPLTMAGFTVGTPSYMSPEQALGDPVDARSDVFSFGVVLYEMLTGTLPFRGSSRSDVLRKLHFDAPVAIERLRPGVPPGLAAVVDKALEKKPEDRYRSMTELRQALDHLDEVPRLLPTARAAGPSKILHLRTVAILTLVLSGAWGLWYSYQRTTTPTSAPAAAGGDASLPQSPHELTQLAAQLVQRQDRADNVDQAIGLLERALTVEPQHAPAHAYLTEAYRRKNANNPDPQWSRLAAESARRALELNADLAIAHTMQGFVDYDAGRFAEAEVRWQRAIELDPTNPLAYLGLGMGYAAQKRDDEAERALRQAVSRRGSDWRPDGELASFFYRRGRFREAAAFYEAARDQSPDNTIVWRNLGAAYFQTDRYDEAAAAFQRALEIMPSAATYTNLGTLRFFQGRYHDAVPAFEKAVELGANRSLYWGNLADAYRWTPGRREESMAAYHRAIALVREEVATQPTNLDVQARLATYLVKSRQLEAALEVVAEVERASSLTSPVLMRMAVVHELAGNRDRALHFLDRALKAGYSVNEVANDPELTNLRADRRYHALIPTSAR
jgi:eukaryotic-like serine/threonine-protein kinase